MKTTMIPTTLKLAILAALTLATISVIRTAPIASAPVQPAHLMTAPHTHIVDGTETHGSGGKGKRSLA